MDRRAGGDRPGRGTARPTELGGGASRALHGGAHVVGAGEGGTEALEAALSSASSLARILSPSPPVVVVVDVDREQAVFLSDTGRALLGEIDVPLAVPRVIAALPLLDHRGRDLLADHPLRRVAAGHEVAGLEVRTADPDRCLWTVGFQVGADGDGDGRLGVLVLMQIDDTELSAASMRTNALGAVDLSFSIADCSRDDMPLVYVNPAFERLTGYAVEEVIGRNCRFLQGPGSGEDAVRRMAEAVRRGNAAVVTLCNRRKDGTTFHNEVTLSPVVDGGRVTHFVGVQRDVTAFVEARAARELADRQREQAREEAEEARDRAVDEAARAEVAHERIAFLERAGALLDANLPTHELAGLLCELVVPQLADAVAVVIDSAREHDHLLAASSRAGRARDLQLEALARAHAPLGQRQVLDGDEAREAGWGRIDIWPLQLDGLDAAVAVARRTGWSGPGEVLDALMSRARPAFVAAHRFTQRAHIAAALQELLLPPVLPVVPGFELAGRYEPAGTGLDVGGDFYDVFATDRGWLLLLGDVCGKGPGAAAVTGIVRATVRALADRLRSPRELLRSVNRAVLAQVPDERFVTALCAMLILEDGRPPTLSFASGGHPLPVLVRDGLARHVGVEGQLLGVLDEVEVVDTDISLTRGDLLLMMTDGVLETPSSYRDEVVQRAASGAAASAEAAASAVMSTVPLDAGRRDDAAVIALRYAG